MRETLVKVKQPTPELDKKGVVYEVPCGECDHVYIGETGRTLRKRLTKHKAAVKKQDHKNCIAVYAWKSGHQVEWKSAKVKEVVPNLSHRRIAEALHIHQTPNTTNLDCRLTVSGSPSSHDPHLFILDYVLTTYDALTSFSSYDVTHVILILLCHPVSTFLPIAALYKSRPL